MSHDGPRSGTSGLAYHPHADASASRDPSVPGPGPPRGTAFSEARDMTLAMARPGALLIRGSPRSAQRPPKTSHLMHKRSPTHEWRQRCLSRFSKRS